MLFTCCSDYFTWTWHHKE